MRRSHRRIVEHALYTIIPLRHAAALPFAIWLMVSYFEEIPREMAEAALLDRARVDRRQRLRESDTVHLAFNSDDIHVFDSATRQRLGSQR